MIFCHIVDDFYLQVGILAKMKQRLWWKEQKEYDDIYKYDYIIALVLHSFSWAFMIVIPLLIVGNTTLLLIISIPTNMIIHCFIDNLKCNKHKISLVADQCAHLGQIFITWLVWVVLF